MGDNIQAVSDLTKGEWDILLPYVQALPADGIIVEIGTGTGGTALYLKDLSQADIYSIDPQPIGYVHDLLPAHDIYFIHKTSEVAAQEWDHGPIDILFIDGAHDFSNILKDIWYWSPLVSDNGIVIFDDYEVDEHGGIGNLAVKIALDGLIETGVVTVVDHQIKILIANINSPVSNQDIDICHALYTKTRNNDDGTIRSRMQVLISNVIEEFWNIHYRIKDTQLQVTFRELVETCRMMQLAKNCCEYESGDIAWISREIAIDQSILNVGHHINKLLREAGI